MDFLTSFQTYLGDCVPNILFEILKKTGYDSEIAVKHLNTEKIDEIESFLSSLNYKFENTIYSPFKRLLPGHRASLLALPSLVSEYEFQKENLKSV